MSDQKEKRISTRFESLTEEEKDNLLKTLITQVFNTAGREGTPIKEFPILKQYAKYGAQAFDISIAVEETKDSIYFVRRDLGA